MFTMCHIILGPGEAGKSTLIKQMQLIHGDNMEMQEKLQKIPYIRQNIFDSMVVSVELCLSMLAIQPGAQVQTLLYCSSVCSFRYIKIKRAISEYTTG